MSVFLVPDEWVDEINAKTAELVISKGGKVSDMQVQVVEAKPQGGGAKVGDVL